MSKFFQKHPKKVGAALGLTAFGIQYFTSPALIQLTTTAFANLLAPIMPSAYAIIGGLVFSALTQVIVGAILAALVSSVIAKMSNQNSKNEDLLPLSEHSIDSEEGHSTERASPTP